jgi:hypothetical protein
MILTPSGLAVGDGLLWDGSGWTAADIATQQELDDHLHMPRETRTIRSHDAGALAADCEAE